MKYKRAHITALIFLMGCLFMLYGVHRKEHQTVEQKSNMICLECIGIG